MRKFIVITALIVAVSWIGFSIYASNKRAESPPAEFDAAFSVITTSRIYYTDHYRQDGENIILEGFWVRGVDGKYNYNDYEFIITPAFGDVKIDRR